MKKGLRAVQRKKQREQKPVLADNKVVPHRRPIPGIWYGDGLTYGNRKEVGHG